ncbi:MAG: tRNA (adenosine(37)-N6)-threonylcarbamoyltransferase complex transferase subunit TsaD [Planctomycetota bacterium]
MKTGPILGIETSCDETAAAVVEGGRRVLSSLVASQVALHAPFRGVVPEIASRAHEESVLPMVRGALAEGGLALDDLGGIAVTTRPGLMGALLVGMSAAKGLALATGLPLTGVNHLEAHVHAASMEGDPPPHPQLALVASGGHTCLFRVEGVLDFRLLGTTVDDAAGEAFDKVASLFGLPYPGGPAVEREARKGRPAVRFPVARVKKRPLHFSFSGLKTAVLYHLEGRGWGPLGNGDPPAEAVPDLAASFQEAAVRALVGATDRAMEAVSPASVVLAGGVALNRRLRDALLERCAARGVPLFVPSDRLCGDNAAMVAGLGFHLLQTRGPDPLDLDAEARVIGKGIGNRE